MKTKLFTLLLTVAASVGTMFAVTIDGLNYNLNDESQTAEVAGNSSASGDIIIPSSVTYNSVTYSVTSIGSSAFQDCTGLTSMTIPNSVTSIGNYAFGGCSSLTSVTIGNSVTSIGEGAFYKCTSLTSPVYNAHVFAYMPTSYSGAYTIPDGIESIAGGAFAYCGTLTSVTIPNSVTSIGGVAFYNCSGLTSVTIPNSVTSIGSSAFQGCTGLTSVMIGNSVTSIGNYAFETCYSLTSVTIGNSVTSIGDYAFSCCSGLTSVTIPNSVTSIGDLAFLFCSGLTSVTIPNSVTSIGGLAFYRCSGLTSVVVEKGNSVYDSRNNCNAIIETATNTLIAGCQNTVIPNSVTSIGGGAFDGCSGLTSVTIPNSVTSIGNSAFFECSGLTSVTIPNSVTSIGGRAFSGCSSLTSINVASDNSYYCSVDGVLFNKNQTELIQYPAGNTRPEYIIPNSVTSIGDYAFYGCSSLTSVTIPDSVTSIGEEAFRGCSGLTSIEIPNSVTSIGSSAFEGCSGLTSVNITDIAAWCNITFSATNSNPLYYAKHLYINDVEVTNLVIPEGVTSIGGHAFSGCSGLTSVTIPNSVTSIGDWAFYDCKSLSSIYNYATSPQVIDNSVFNGEEVEYEGIQYYGPVDKSICKLYVPAGSIDLYKAAEGWKDFTNIQAIVCSVSLVCDSVRGSIEGDSGEFDYLSQLTYTAVPNEGYYFIQWSDGVADNPRTIELTQDTILTALFDSIPAGQDTTATAIKNDSVAVSATPTEDNSVILEWPAVEGADTYTIAIYKNDELICTLVFDAEGHLISIRFAAPARDGNGRNIPVAEQAANGWRYVVNGLEGNATYTYSVVAQDENGNVLLSESIDFTMPVLLSVDNIDSSSLQGGDRGRLILRNGTIFILRGDKIYNAQGALVK